MFYLLDLNYVLVQVTDLYVIWDKVHTKCCVPLWYICATPLGGVWLEHAISTYATVVSLRGSVGMSSIRSAVSYVVAVVNLCVVFRECLAYALRIANGLGVTPLLV